MCRRPCTWHSRGIQTCRLAPSVRRHSPVLTGVRRRQIQIQLRIQARAQRHSRTSPLRVLLADSLRLYFPGYRWLTIAHCQWAQATRTLAPASHGTGARWHNHIDIRTNPHPGARDFMTKPRPGVHIAHSSGGCLRVPLMCHHCADEGGHGPNHEEEATQRPHRVPSHFVLAMLTDSRATPRGRG